MTANADLLTKNLENILLVPNEAINVDRSKGTYSVNLVTTDADGNPTTETISVTIGLRDRNNTQIISGLNEGDVLRVGNAAPRFSFGQDENGEGGGPPRDENGNPGGGGPFGGG
jgi:multidrug efflux pump subunit AcrA (membrane-fusion protein)